MRYESQKTPKGNIGVSYSSQDAADKQSAEMDYNNCSGCSGCSRCSVCSGCSDCSDCSDCSGILVWRGGVAEKLIAINGLNWPVSTDGIKIQIGCQSHTIEQWSEFEDGRITLMDSQALYFWKQFKPTILAMATYRASLNPQP